MIIKISLSLFFCLILCPLLAGCEEMHVNLEDFENTPYVSIKPETGKEGNVLIKLGYLKKVSSLWVKLRIEVNGDIVEIRGEYSSSEQPWNYLYPIPNPEKIKFYWVDQKGKHALRVEKLEDNAPRTSD